MGNNQKLDEILKSKYCGRILSGLYSNKLEGRLAYCINRFHAFDESTAQHQLVPITYIA